MYYSLVYMQIQLWTVYRNRKKKRGKNINNTDLWIDMGWENSLFQKSKYP